MKKNITVPAYTAHHITISDTDVLWQHEHLYVTITVLEHATVTLHLALTQQVVAHLCVEVFLTGDYASFQAHGYYMLAGNHKLTISTLQHHTGTKTTSSFLTKGLVYERAAGMYDGMIYIAPQACGTYATVHNKNILLSPTARMKSKPNIEVACADVQCFHGSAIAPLDEQLIWYMMNRGVPRFQAEGLLLDAFLHDVRMKQS